MRFLGRSNFIEHFCCESISEIAFVRRKNNLLKESSCLGMCHGYGGEKMYKFESVIETEEQLRSIIREPHQLVANKSLTHLDRHCGIFIGRSPFLLISTCSAKGDMTISPKGDPEGFVKILNNKTLAIPDRPGNNRVDSMRNILQNPKVGLLFMIPGKSETLRVNGRAKIVQDKSLRDSMSVNDRSPKLVIVVDVEEALFHCSKCIIRSSLWDQNSWPSLEGLPSLAETLISVGNLDLSESEMHKIVVRDEKKRLY